MENCEICRGQSFRKLFNASDYRLNTTDKIFTLKQCRHCGHVVLLPKPDRKSLDSYYPDSFYSADGKDILTDINYKFALNRISRIIESGRLLDIGCGSGGFLKAAAEYGYDVYGQEISSEGARIAGEKHDGRIFNKDLIDCSFDSDFFDVITLWHVAEHVYDLKKYFNEIYRIIKPNGTLIIEVPNFNCIERKIFNSYSIIIDAPRHLRHFTKKTLGKFLRDCGFECEINNGWSLLVSPLSILNSGRNFIHEKIKREREDFIYKLAFLPLILLSGINSLFSILFRTQSIIGARCTKLDGT